MSYEGFIGILLGFLLGMCFMGWALIKLFMRDFVDIIANIRKDIKEVKDALISNNPKLRSRISSKAKAGAKINPKDS
jgi:hypothetical protein